MTVYNYKVTVQELTRINIVIVKRSYVLYVRIIQTSKKETGKVLMLCKRSV